jgi:uncharacterized protein (UPF0276 family)
VSFRRLGSGIGLRPPHYEQVLTGEPKVDWFEAITENFLGSGGNPRRVLEAVRARWPVVLHGVSLGIGNTDPLPLSYLASVKALADRIEPEWVSDHLCFGGNGGHYAHDLWPIPYTEEALAHVVERVARVQDALGRQLVLENVSAYAEFQASTLTEWEFLAAVATRADCMILLDVNNVCVSAHNFGFDPRTYLEGIPADRVAQYHLAGHQQLETHRLDTHDHPVPDEVWNLFDVAIERFGPAASIVEWDDHIPELAELEAAAARARAALERA